MKVGYIVKSQAHTLEDTIYFKDIYLLDNEEKRELVHDACEYAWDHNDGWEWLYEGAILTLVVDNVEHGDFPVDVESKPVFIVRKQI